MVENWESDARLDLFARMKADEASIKERANFKEQKKDLTENNNQLMAQLASAIEVLKTQQPQVTPINITNTNNPTFTNNPSFQQSQTAGAFNLNQINDALEQRFEQLMKTISANPQQDFGSQIAALQAQVAELSKQKASVNISTQTTPVNSTTTAAPTDNDTSFSRPNSSSSNSSRRSSTSSDSTVTSQASTATTVSLQREPVTPVEVAPDVNPAPNRRRASAPAALGSGEEPNPPRYAESPEDDDFFDSPTSPETTAPIQRQDSLRYAKSEGSDDGYGNDDPASRPDTPLPNVQIGQLSRVPRPASDNEPDYNLEPLPPRPNFDEEERDVTIPRSPELTLSTQRRTMVDASTQTEPDPAAKLNNSPEVKAKLAELPNNKTWYKTAKLSVNGGLILAGALTVASLVTMIVAPPLALPLFVAAVGVGVASSGAGIGIHTWAVAKASSIKNFLIGKADNAGLDAKAKEEFIKPAEEQRKSARNNLIISGAALGAFVVPGGLMIGSFAVPAFAVACALAIAATVTGFTSGIGAGAIGLYKGIKSAANWIASAFTNKPEAEPAVNLNNRSAPGDLLLATKYSGSLQTKLENTPVEQRVDKLMLKDANGQTVLYYASKNEQSLDVVVSMLSTQQIQTIISDTKNFGSTEREALKTAAADLLSKPPAAPREYHAATDGHGYQSASLTRPATAESNNDTNSKVNQKDDDNSYKRPGG